MKKADISALQKTVFDYYAASGRHTLPWRLPEPDGSFEPYKIVVSELMLQQTQVSRVVPKFALFIEAFPHVGDLANAPLHDVLSLWSGLGYNRRAKFLWQTAQHVVEHYDGVFPATAKELVALPGIGVNTAGAILTYAFNQPAVFIETNIRTIFIHHFFPESTVVDDAALRPLIGQSIPEGRAREWYWALMDYGTYLKQITGNTAARRSSSYAKQSAFEGSRRQIRGHILRLLAEQPWTYEGLQAHIPDERLGAVLQDLSQEGFIDSSESFYYLRA